MLGQGTDTPRLPRVELAVRTRADLEILLKTVALLIFATGAPVPRLRLLMKFSAFSLMVGSPEMGGMEKVNCNITLSYMALHI